MPLAPHDFWQEIFAPGSFAAGPGIVHRDFYPATLPDGRQILLPIRVLPGDGSAGGGLADRQPGLVRGA